MKRILTLMVTIGIIFGLTACGGNDEDAAEPKETKDNTATEEEVEEEETVPEEEIEEPEEKAEDSTTEEESEGNSEITEYEESDIIEEEVDVSGLDVEIETDNENTRVILFKDGNKAVYKTVYVKNDQRLKIIDIIDNEGQIYNEVIK